MTLHMSGTRHVHRPDGHILSNPEQYAHGYETHRLFQLSQSSQSRSTCPNMSMIQVYCFEDSSRSRTRSLVRPSVTTRARPWFWMRGYLASVRNFNSCTSTITILYTDVLERFRRLRLYLSFWGPRAQSHSTARTPSMIPYLP